MKRVDASVAEAIYEGSRRAASRCRDSGFNRDLFCSVLFSGTLMESVKDQDSGRRMKGKRKRERQGRMWKDRGRERESKREIVRRVVYSYCTVSKQADTCLCFSSYYCLHKLLEKETPRLPGTAHPALRVYE